MSKIIGNVICLLPLKKSLAGLMPAMFLILVENFISDRKLNNFY